METSQTKKCIYCKKVKNISNFYKDKKLKSKHTAFCKPCSKEYSKKFIKTKSGLGSDIFKKQKIRAKKRNHNDSNYSVLEFKKWLFSQPNFDKLYNKWVDSNYNRDLRPSVDRLDDYKGYSFDNMQLVTWAENNKKGHADRKNGINNKINQAVNQYDLSGNFIKEYYSQTEAYRQTGVPQSSISKQVNSIYTPICSKYIWRKKGYSGKVVLRKKLNHESKIRSDNTSGYKGVSFDKSRNKWSAVICINKKCKNLGRYNTAIQAFRKREEYKKKHNIK